MGRLPAAGGNSGLGNRDLCDHPSGSVDSVLHPQDASQPPAHVHLPVWISKEAPELIFTTFVRDLVRCRIA